MKLHHPARSPLLTGRRCALLLLLATPFAVAQQSSASLSSPLQETARVPVSAPIQIQWGDFDADGLDDALTLTSEGGVQLLHNLGDGSFVEVTHLSGLEAVSNGVFAIWQDHDGDGLTPSVRASAHQLYPARHSSSIRNCAVLA